MRIHITIETDASSKVEVSWSVSDDDAAAPKGPSSPKAIEAPAAQENLVPPGEGNWKTQTRNARRRDARRLNALKRIGKLPSNATLTDLKSYREAQDGSQNRLPETGMEPVVDDVQEPQPSTEIAVIELAPEVLQEREPPNEVVDEEPAPKRARLDIAGSRRLVFSSLGVRTPKTPAEEDKLREKLKLQAARSPKKGPALTESGKASGGQEDSGKEAGKQEDSGKKAGQQEVSGKEIGPIQPSGVELDVEEEEIADDDPDYWKSKIKLSAVECVDEGIKLSTPPFPFVQRWDPQQQLPKSRKKKRKRSSARDYDNALLNAVFENEELSPTVGATEPQTEPSPQVTGPAEPEPEDDLPPLPTDPTALPELRPADAVSGAVIAFQRLELSAATQWSPTLSPWRTAMIKEAFPNESTGPGEDMVIAVALAARDRRPAKKKTFDHNGRRVYDKFESVDDEGEEDGEEDGLVYLGFGELLGPRMLRRPEAPSKDDSVAANGRPELP